LEQVIVAAELTQDANDFQQLQPIHRDLSHACRRWDPGSP
jgi:hypothetical protein